MKITDILTFGVNLGDGNHIFVRVLTDEHLHGTGEAYRVGPDTAVEQTIATGEMLYTKYEFRDVIAARAADILQPDLLLCGGLLEAKKIAAMAEAHYLTMAPHNPLGPVSTAVSAHFAISTPNFLILEYQPDSEGPSRNLVLKTFPLRDGYLEVPDAPGLGIELNERAFAGNPLKTWRRQLVTEFDGNVGFQ